jgi:hypothetical protein
LTRFWCIVRRSRAWAASIRRCGCSRLGFLFAPGGEWRTLPRRARQCRHRAAPTRQRLQPAPLRARPCWPRGARTAPAWARSLPRLRARLRELADLATPCADQRGAAARRRDRPQRPPRQVDRHVPRRGTPTTSHGCPPRQACRTVAAPLTASTHRGGGGRRVAPGAIQGVPPERVRGFDRRDETGKELDLRLGLRAPQDEVRDREATHEKFGQSSE